MSYFNKVKQFFKEKIFSSPNKKDLRDDISKVDKSSIEQMGQVIPPNNKPTNQMKEKKLDSARCQTKVEKSEKATEDSRLLIIQKLSYIIKEKCLMLEGANNTNGYLTEATKVNTNVKVNSSELENLLNEQTSGDLIEINSRPNNELQSESIELNLLDKFENTALVTNNEMEFNSKNEISKLSYLLKKLLHIKENPEIIINFHKEIEINIEQEIKVDNRLSEIVSEYYVGDTKHTITMIYVSTNGQTQGEYSWANNHFKISENEGIINFTSEERKNNNQLTSREINLTVPINNIPIMTDEEFGVGSSKPMKFIEKKTFYEINKIKKLINKMYFNSNNDQFMGLIILYKLSKLNRVEVKPVTNLNKLFPEKYYDLLNVSINDVQELIMKLINEDLIIFEGDYYYVQSKSSDPKQLPVMTVKSNFTLKLQEASYEEVIETFNDSNEAITCQQHKDLKKSHEEVITEKGINQSSIGVQERTSEADKQGSKNLDKPEIIIKVSSEIDKDIDKPGVSNNREVVSEYRIDGTKHTITMVYVSTNGKLSIDDSLFDKRFNISENEGIIRFTTLETLTNKHIITKEEIVYELEEKKERTQPEKKKVETPKIDPLAFLDAEFEADLTKTIKSKDFAYRLATFVEAPDYSLNKEYIAEYQNSDTKSREALEIIASANTRLVVKNVKRYSYLSTPSFTEEDMFQHGMMGLMRAAEKFDISRGFEFSTYATYWIRQSIMRGIMEYANTIRIPVHMGELIRKVISMQHRSYEELGFVDYDWIAKEMDLPLEKVLYALRVNNAYGSNVSLDTPVGTDESTYLGDFIEDTAVIHPEKHATDKALAEDINRLLLELNPRERGIIERRFGFNNGEINTLEEIGKVYGVTRERIRQIESKALKKLSHPNRKNILKDYFENYG